MDILEIHEIGDCTITKKYCDIKGYVYTHYSKLHNISFDEEYPITDESLINKKATQINEN